MNIHRYILLSITALLCITLIGLYILLDWRQGKIEALSTPLSIRFSGVNHSPASKVRVVLFGDSRMAQWHSPWPSQYEVINRGVSGSTSFQTYERLARDVLVYQPDWVVIQVGINDIVASRLLLGDARRKAVNEVVLNIENITREISNSGAKVILMSLVPEINADLLRLLIWQGSLLPDVERINRALNVTDLPNVVQLNAADIFVMDDAWRTDYSRDALHWNVIAYKATLDKVLAIIER